MTSLRPGTSALAIRQLETVVSLLGVDLRPLLAQALDRGVKAVTLVVLPPLG